MTAAANAHDVNLKQRYGEKKRKYTTNSHTRVIGIQQVYKLYHKRIENKRSSWESRLGH